MTRTLIRADACCLSDLDLAALVFDAPWTRFGALGPHPVNGVAAVLRRVRPDLAYAHVPDDVERMIDFGPDLLYLTSDSPRVHAFAASTGALLVTAGPKWTEEVVVAEATTTTAVVLALAYRLGSGL
jgi:hypothetical protein